MSEHKQSSPLIVLAFIGVALFFGWIFLDISTADSGANDVDRATTELQERLEQIENE